ncbi:hypothetical protein ANAPC5_01320 [Anaplasma phagocytophilum]|nr:hypothetical protein ANAPC5_01320 [Anaplasma phagocytophilum]
MGVNNLSYLYQLIIKHVFSPLFLRAEKTIRSNDIAKMKRQLISQERLDFFKNRIYNEAAANDAFYRFIELFTSVYNKCFPTVEISHAKFRVNPG